MYEYLSASIVLLCLSVCLPPSLPVCLPTYLFICFALGIFDESQELEKVIILFLDYLVTRQSCADAPGSVLAPVVSKPTLPTVPSAQQAL